MSRRTNTRYPHAFSKGRQGPSVVSDGSWRLAPDDPRRTMFEAKATVGFLSAKQDHTLASLIPRQLGLGIRCSQCRPGHDKILRPLEAVASYGGPRPFAIAGLWKPGEGNQPDAFTMLTTEPGPDVAPIHGRQIAVLAPGTWSRWLVQADNTVLSPLRGGALAVETVRSSSAA